MDSKIKIWVKVSCDANVRNELKMKFQNKCDFNFTDDNEPFPCNQAEIIIGEPSRKEILMGKNIKWIQLTWAGADKYIELKDIMKNIILTNASGAFGEIISEYVIGAIISLYRKFPQYWKNQQNHIWAKSNSSYTIFGKKVLILGTGDIGRNIACRLRAFDADISGIRRKKSDEPIEGFDKVFDLSLLDNLIPKADIIIGCLPSTEKTKGLMTYNRLKNMKKDAIFINVGRGDLVEDNDLVKVLKLGHLKGAALDVMSEEPLPVNSDLWDMENVIITPHIAGPSFDGNKNVQDSIWKLCIENIERYLNGKELINVVDFSKGY